MQPLSTDGGQAGVGIPQHQIAFRLQFAEQLIAPPQNVAAGHAQILAHHGNKNVRAILPKGVLQFKVFPENGGKVSVPVLVVVDYATVKVFPAALDNSRQPNDFWTGAAPNHDLGTPVVFPFKIVFHSILLSVTDLTFRQ